MDALRSTPSAIVASSDHSSSLSSSASSSSPSISNINVPVLPVPDLLARFIPDGSHRSSGLHLHRMWIENDDIAEKIRNGQYPPWDLLEIISCQGSRVPHLMATALQISRIKRLALRKITTPLEECFQALCSTSFVHLNDLTMELAISELSCRRLAMALEPSSLTTLRFVRCVFACQFALHVLAGGLKCNSSISTLSFTKCQLRDEDFHILIPKLPSSIRTLDLADNYCRAKGMAALSSLLLRDDQAIKVVNLTNQHPGEYGGSLDLCLSGLALSTNRTLKELDLSFNMLSINDIRILVDALSTNSTLQKLNLMSNQLNDQAIDYIGRHLPRMTGLRLLNITANRFGDTAAQSLCEGLKRNFTLTQLQTPLGFAASEDINYLVALNRGGRRLLQDWDSGARVPVGLWSIIIERIYGRPDVMSSSLKASVVYFLLRGANL